MGIWRIPRRFALAHGEPTIISAHRDSLRLSFQKLNPAQLRSHDTESIDIDMPLEDREEQVLKGTGFSVCAWQINQPLLLKAK
jgi:hypothetical protein